MKIFILWLVLVFNFYFVSAQLNLIRHDPYVIDTVFVPTTPIINLNSNSNYWYVGESRFLNLDHQSVYTNGNPWYWNNSTSSLALSDSLYNPSFLTGDGASISSYSANCDGCAGFCYYSEDYKNKELWVSWSYVQFLKLAKKQTFGFSVSKFDSLGNWQFTTIIDSSINANINYSSSIQVHPNGELWGVRGGTENSSTNLSFFRVSSSGQVLSVISDTVISYNLINKFELASDSTFLVHHDSTLTI